jgi:hypothetical protein
MKLHTNLRGRDYERQGGCLQQSSNDLLPCLLRDKIDIIVPNSKRRGVQSDGKTA